MTDSLTVWNGLRPASKLAFFVSDWTEKNETRRSDPRVFPEAPIHALYNFAVSKQPAPPPEKTTLQLARESVEVSQITMERLLEARDAYEMKPIEIVEYALNCENIGTEGELDAFLCGFTYGRDAAAKG